MESIDHHLRQTILKNHYSNIPPLFKLDGEPSMVGATCLDMIDRLRQSLEDGGYPKMNYLPAEGNGSVHHAGVLRMEETEFFLDPSLWQQQALNLSDVLDGKMGFASALPQKKPERSFTIQLTKAGDEVLAETMLRKIDDKMDALRTRLFNLSKKTDVLPDDEYDVQTVLNHKKLLISAVMDRNDIVNITMDVRGRLSVQRVGLKKINERNKPNEFEPAFNAAARALGWIPYELREYLEKARQKLKRRLG